MALKKQSIRKGMYILVNDSPITKEELILISESWDEKQESFFRKMLKQGGKFKLNNVSYDISLQYNDRLRSDGTKDKGIIQIPGKSSKF